MSLFRALAQIAAVVSTITLSLFVAFEVRADTIVQPPFQARAEALANSVFGGLGASDQKVGNPTLLASATWEAGFAEARVEPFNSLHSFATATTSGHASSDALF